MTAVPTQTDPGADAALACVLLTGASGALGQVLREPLRQRCLQAGGRLRLSDRVALPGAPLQEGEEFVACDLADRPGMHALLRGVKGAGSPAKSRLLLSVSTQPSPARTILELLLGAGASAPSEQLAVP